MHHFMQLVILPLLMKRLLIGVWFVWLVGCSQPTPEIGTATPMNTATPIPLIGINLATMVRQTAVSPILQTPTPLPTATPTPTATPIIYTIAEGDTLLGIAIEQNSTVEQIQTLNPNARPEALQIGQQLILPPPATAVAQTNLATSIPLNLEISTIHQQRTPLGDIWIVGELTNNGQAPAEAVRLEIRLQTTNNDPLATVQTWVEPSIIPAGATAPFATLIREVEQEVSLGAPVVQVIEGQTAVDLGTRLQQFAIVQDVLANEQLTGLIRNLEPVTAVNIQLVITFYDDEQTILGYQTTHLTDPLPPDSMAPFQVLAAPPAGTPTRYQILIHATTGEDP